MTPDEEIDDKVQYYKDGGTETLYYHFHGIGLGFGVGLRAIRNKTREDGDKAFEVYAEFESDKVIEFLLKTMHPHMIRRIMSVLREKGY
jgi:hypothetical protein